VATLVASGRLINYQEQGEATRRKGDCCGKTGGTRRRWATAFSGVAGGEERRGKDIEEAQRKAKISTKAAYRMGGGKIFWRRRRKASGGKMTLRRSERTAENGWATKAWRVDSKACACDIARHGGAAR
jgi:hypothetical protein